MQVWLSTHMTTCTACVPKHLNKMRLIVQQPERSAQSEELPSESR